MTDINFFSCIIAAIKSWLESYCDFLESFISRDSISKIVDLIVFLDNYNVYE